MAELIKSCHALSGTFTVTGYTTSSVPFTINMAAGQTANALEIKTSTGTPVYWITPGGDVHYIGDEYITDHLTVNGGATIGDTLSVTNLATVGSLVSTGNATVGGVLNVTGNSTFSSAVTIQNNLTVNGGFTTTGTVLFPNGSVTAPSISFTSDPNSGFYWVADGDLRWACNGVLAVEFGSAGIYTNTLGTVGAITLTLKGAVADGASAVGTTIGSSNTLSTSGAKLVSFVNNATEKAYITKDGFYNSTSTINQNTVSSLTGSQTASLLQDGSSYTATDATMATEYIAVKFTASAAHTMGDFALKIKESADITNTTATLTGYIYADDGGAPSKPTGSALVTGLSIRFGTITGTYQELSVGTTYTMVNGTTYWLVLVYSAIPTGGNIVLDSAVSSNMGATSADGTTWTNTDVQLWHKIRGLTYFGVQGSSTNNIGVYGLSTNYIGVQGSSTNNIGVYGSSTNSIGVYGLSTSSIGVQGSSTNNIGVQGSSTSSIGVYGLSTSSIGVYGLSTNYIGVYGSSMNSQAGYFTRNTASPTTAVVDIIQNHASDANIVLKITGKGTGLLTSWVFDVTEKASISKDGTFGSVLGAVTLGAAATTFAAAGNVMTITGDAGGNTVATITAGVTGQQLTLIFVDDKVAITDTAAATANTVNLSAAFTSAANTTLTLVFNGTKWFEVARSVNG